LSARAVGEKRGPSGDFYKTPAAMTKSPYIVIKLTEIMTNWRQFVINPFVETINQCGFIAVSPVSRSKLHHLKTNPDKKSMTS
jgi:hypothetical protein